jgi:hypothetical protein
MLRRVALVRTDVSEELSASFIRVTRICELETTLALTSNRRTLQRNTTLPSGHTGHSPHHIKNSIEFVLVLGSLHGISSQRLSVASYI